MSKSVYEHPTRKEDDFSHIKAKFNAKIERYDSKAISTNENIIIETYSRFKDDTDDRVYTCVFSLETFNNHKYEFQRFSFNSEIDALKFLDIFNITNPDWIKIFANVYNLNANKNYIDKYKKRFFKEENFNLSALLYCVDWEEMFSSFNPKYSSHRKFAECLIDLIFNVYDESVRKQYVDFIIGVLSLKESDSFVLNIMDEVLKKEKKMDELDEMRRTLESLRYEIKTLKEENEVIKKEINSAEKKVKVESGYKEERIGIDDFKKAYAKSFDEFYDLAKKYYDVLDDDLDQEFNKEEIKNNGVWGQLAFVVGGFDIDKIVKHIVAINEKASGDDMISSADVEDPTSAKEWKKCIYDDLRTVVGYWAKDKNVSRDNTYNGYQSGRVHLDCIYVHDCINVFDNEIDNPIMKLYWTDEQITDGEDW